MISRRDTLRGLGAAVILSGCSHTSHRNTVAKAYPQGRVDVYNPSLLSLISTEAKLELLADGFKWTEGPTWDSKRGHLYFSDIPNNRIHTWDAENGTKVFLDPAGRDGASIDPNAAPGTNGLAYRLSDDSLFISNQSARSVDRLSLAGGDREAILTHFGGQPFNSPNDIVYTKSGVLFFTDPPYGLKDQDNFTGKMQPHYGVYRLGLDGKVRLISDRMTFPNGIALSPDENTLYVSQSDDLAPIIRLFKLNDHGLSVSETLFHDFSDLIGAEAPGKPDGMAVDFHGNIFATGPGGVIILSPTGKRLGRIYTGRATANCAFGEDGSTLFMTAHDTLLAIKTRTRGKDFMNPKTL